MMSEMIHSSLLIELEQININAIKLNHTVALFRSVIISENLRTIHYQRQ